MLGGQPARYAHDAAARMAAASAQEEAGDGRGRKRRMRLARPDRTRKVQLVQSQRAVENVLPNTKKTKSIPITKGSVSNPFFKLEFLLHFHKMWVFTEFLLGLERGLTPPVRPKTRSRSGGVSTS